LLGFNRPESLPADVAAIVSRLSRLLALRDGSRLDVSDSTDGRARTTAPAAIARAVVARSVLSALAGDGTIACEIAVDDGIFVRVTGASHASAPDPELVAIALPHGVHIEARGQSQELRFPAVEPRAIPNASS
jgi:hypothetical protein